MNRTAPSALALLALTLSCAEAQKPVAPKVQKELDRGASSFIKFEDKPDGAGQLATSIVTYKDDKGRTVELISAVHIADRIYYEKLEERFEGYDSLLYEMVKPKNAKPTIVKKSSGGISYIQRSMKKMLDLEFQLDGIDYTASNFVHADLTAEAFQKMSKDRGENIFGVLMGGLSKGKKKDGKKDPTKKDKPMHFGHILAALMSKDSARNLKMLMARQLQHAEAMLAGLEDGKDGKGSVLLTERNKKCVAVIEEQLKKGDRKLGVFYGGAHMPDIERRLRKDFGFTKQKEEWLVAWDIPAAKKKATSKPTSQPAKR